MTFAAVVVSELIACATADLPLAAVRALSVNTAFTRIAVMRAQQTLINVSIEESYGRVYVWGSGYKKRKKDNNGS